MGHPLEVLHQEYKSHAPLKAYNTAIMLIYYLYKLISYVRVQPTVAEVKLPVSVIANIKCMQWVKSNLLHKITSLHLLKVRKPSYDSAIFCQNINRVQL